METGKKIIIVSRAFYPTNSPRSLRTTALVKEFARRGHDVTLFTVKNDAVHIPFEEEYGVTIKDIGPLRFPGIEIKSKFGLFRIVQRILRRLLLFLFEYPNIELMYKVARALRKESGYDLMISIAVPYPVHWGVAKARRKGHRIAEVWAADCGDPFCGLENDSFKPPFYFSYIEKWFCRKADYITIPLEEAKPAYFPEFYSKIRIIPQGLAFPEINYSTHHRNGVITFAYFGNIRSYLHYAVPFLERLNAVNQDFTFVAYTQDRTIFERTLNKKTLEKCRINDYVERNILLEELRGVDFLVHFPYQKETQKSLKLIDYYFLDKPILSYTNDTRSDRVLKEFLKFNFTNRSPVEDYRKYDIRNVCSQFIELLPKKNEISSNLIRFIEEWE